MNWTLWAQIATVIIGTATLFTILGWCGRRLFNFGRKVGEFFDSWLGEPSRDGLAERPGVMQRLTTLEANTAVTRETVEAIQAELPKNGVPLSIKIDRLWQKFVSDEERAREEHAHRPH